MQCCSTIHLTLILHTSLHAALFCTLICSDLLSNFLPWSYITPTNFPACLRVLLNFLPLRCVELLSNSLLTFPSQNFLICLWLPFDFLWSSCYHLDVLSAHRFLNYSIKAISQCMQLQTLQIYLCLIITQKAFSILYDSLLFEIHVTRRSPCHTKRGLNDFHLASFCIFSSNFSSCFTTYNDFDIV